MDENLVIKKDVESINITIPIDSTIGKNSKIYVKPEISKDISISTPNNNSVTVNRIPGLNAITASIEGDVVSF